MTIPACPRRRPLRPRASRRIAVAAAALVVAVCGACTGLTPEERDALSEYQSRAQLYWEGRNYESALRMIDKGLDLAPQDYKLRNIAAACYFRLRDRGPDNLRRAERYAEDVHDERDPEDHGPQHLYFYARIKQQIGLEHERQANVYEREAANTDLTASERTIRRARADEHRRRAREYWTRAARAYRRLLAREELLRLAHEGLFQIATERNDYGDAVHHAMVCLDRNVSEQEAKRANIRETMTLEHELFLRDQLGELIDQELRVRQALAEMHFRQGAYAKSVEQLDKILAADPSRSTDYYNRARALEKLGREQEARRDYEKFLGTTDLPNTDERVRRAFRFNRDAGV